MTKLRDALDQGNKAVCLQECFQRGLAHGTVTNTGGTLKRANCPDDEGKQGEGNPPAGKSLSAPVIPPTATAAH